jgi:hypothetical protein
MRQLRPLAARFEVAASTLLAVAASKLAVVAALAALAPGCMMPPSPAERATEAATQLNIAARFNQMDVAVSHTAAAARPDFMKRHAEWGQSLRIVDVEMASMSMPESDKAIVLVDYAWIRQTEGTMRATRVEQTWRDDGGWHLVRERRISGDIGLLGEPIPATTTEKAPDKQFASRTIHADGTATTSE